MSVSVIIPSYNHRQYVIQAIESVLDQEWPEIDLIVIDDGSKDESPEEIRRLLERRGGFRFFARENRGLMRTLNEGLELAKGEFFCELASDDYFPPGSLSLRVDFLRTHPECVAVFGDGYLIEDRGATDVKLSDTSNRSLYQANDQIFELLAGNRPTFSTGLTRTAVLREIGCFDAETFRYYEDLDTPVRLAMAGRLGYLDRPVICRRIHATNVSGTTSHIRGEKIAYYRKLIADPRMDRYRRVLKRSLRREYLKLGRLLSRKGCDPCQRELLRQGWSYIFSDPRLLCYILKVSFQKDRPLNDR